MSLKRVEQLASLNALLWGIVSPILFFALQLAIPNRAAVGSAAVALLTVSSLSWIGTTIWMVVTRREVPLRSLVVMVVSAALWLFETFTLLYWNIGTARNFGHSLSHLDAAYFMLGTLTTAGTGSIAPISESARLVVTIQYVVDLGFVAIILGALVGHLVERRAPVNPT